MMLTVRRSADALRIAAGDLARLWRVTRNAGGTNVFPGALDGVMEDFLERAADSLLPDRRAEDAWASTHGVVRLLPKGEAAAALADEWYLARAVLLSACEALEVAPEAVEAVHRAVDAAAAGVEPLLAGHGPGGVVAVHQLGGFRPRGDSRNGGPR